MSLVSSGALGLVALALLVWFSKRSTKTLIALCHHFGLSSAFAGLTVLSIVTSLPEIFAHLAASVGILAGTLRYDVASATVVGANIGSDVFQQMLLLGAALLLAGRFVFTRPFLHEALYPLIGASALALAVGMDGSLSRLDGVFLLLAFFAYLYVLYRYTDSHLAARAQRDMRLGRDVALAAAYVAGMLLSASFFLRVTEDVVVGTGIGGSLLGLLTLGVAAASPELFTALNAYRAGEAEASLGTLIGSNVTNPLFALGLGAALSTYAVPFAVVAWDLPVKIAAAALLVPLALRGPVGRKTGVALIAVYALFVAGRIVLFPGQ